MWDTKQSVEQMIGGRLRDAARARNFGYVYPISFATTIASGGTGTYQLKTLADRAFVVDAITGSIRNSAGTTRLDRADDSPPLFLTFSTNEGAWQSDEVEWASLVGTAEQPFFPLFRWVISAGATLTVKCRNAHTATVTPRISLIGHAMGLV